MEKVESAKQRRAVSKLYERYLFKYPVISAVIHNQQAGEVLVDADLHPSVAFVCHQFGWCQIIGYDDRFIEQLQEFLFEKELFCSHKLRAFCPEVRHANIFEKYAEQSERQRHLLSMHRINNVMIFKKSLNRYEFTVSALDNEKAITANQKLGLDLFNRFWPSKEVFNDNAIGHVVFDNGEPIAICYSCAQMGSYAEIDVFTHPTYRRKGAAMLACIAFIDECKEKHLKPVWDCFTNNSGSMHLANKLGFDAVDEAYAFFTYNRRSVET